jgi:hypothetical protein
VYKKEEHKLVSKKKVKISIAEKDGKWLLDTNVYDLLKDFRDGIITSDVLGKAFEPEQRFENPDGTGIIFDRDYFGDHRGTDALPGPFASEEQLSRTLW